MSLVGYARVSTREQNVDAQVSVLEAAGAERVFVDVGQSSRKAERSQWVACLDYLRPGDVLLIRALDRLAGTERLAIETILDLNERGVEIRSLTEPAIDTTGPMGHAMLGMLAVFAQLRVDTIRENTRRGLEHARAQGRVGGRPTVWTPEKLDAARRLRASGASWSQISAAVGISRSTVARTLKGDV